MITFMLSVALALAATTSTSSNRSSGTLTIYQAGSNDPRRLEASIRIDREIASGDTHPYVVSLTSGQYLRVTVAHQALILDRVIDDPIRESATLFELASVERDLGHLEQAQALAEQGLPILESSRLKLSSADLRGSFFGRQQKYYEIYIDILMRRHKQQPAAGFDAAALQASESRRARGLLEILVEAHADFRQGIDPALIGRENALRLQLQAKAAEQDRLRDQPVKEAEGRKQKAEGRRQQ